MANNNFLTVCLMVIVYLIFSWVPMKHALHMFQQNRYEVGRYGAWLRGSGKVVYEKSLLVNASIALLVVGSFFVERGIYQIITIVVVTILAGIMILNEVKEEYIKPLVFTDRVKRQVLIQTALNVIILIALFKLTTYWDLFSILYLFYGCWIMIFAMAFITQPIEEGVKRRFLNDAKKTIMSQSNLVKIGITGSYGKTSSKTILQEILSEKFYSLMTPASYNTPMGITRTIRELLKPIHEVFICEMGADHVGDIQELCDFIHPKIGLVTSIGPQHLNTFGSLENIITEKMKLIENLPEDGCGILNMDNEHIKQYSIKNKCKILTYGIHDENVDYYAKNIEYSPKGSKFEIQTKEGIFNFETKLLGEHNIANICAAIAVARELEIEWKDVQQAVKKVNYVEHRLELKKINGYTFVDNAFNSNPVGSSMSLEVMKMMPNKRFIITPGMIDLGSKQDELNKEFGFKMKDKIDEVILVGVQQTQSIVEGLKESEFDMDHVHVCKTVREAFTLVYTLATPQDTILLENDLPDAFNN